jgi:uncharacterized membrane protein
MFKPSYLVKGFPGHPLHPPMTGGAIGAYTAAVVLGCLGAVGIAEDALAKGWWLALLVGLGFGALAALTGLAEWITMTWGTPLWQLVDEPTAKAVTPGHAEKEQADEG